jgi:regulator of sigma E protease
MNFLVGVLIVAVVLFWQPRYATTQLTAVEEWSYVGGEQGLQAGDTIVEFNGDKIRVYQDFTLATLLLPDGNYDIVVERDGNLVTLENVPMIRQLAQYEDGTQAMLYGISFGVADTTVESVPSRIWPTTMNYVKSVIVSLKMLFTGQAGIQDVGGPVKIVQMMSEVAEASGSTEYAIMNLLDFGAMIAINLAVMNLLPFPALDGGRVVGLLLTTSVEAITRKKINPKIEGYIHGAGMILLLILMGVIMLKDIWGLF